jgi:hypothetical protein
MNAFEVRAKLLRNVFLKLSGAVLPLLLPLMLSACATNSIFNPYPSQAQAFRTTISQEQAYESVKQDLEDAVQSKDGMLYGMELGRLEQVNEQYENSKQVFSDIINAFEQQDLEATVSLSGIGSQGASLLTNDNAIPYRGAGYERIATHHHQALNYWALRDYEGAGVEFRKVALEQQFLTQKHEKEIAEASKAASENDIAIDGLEDQFVGLDALTGNVKSSFLNPYTYASSGVFWEGLGEWNEALVDYKKAYEMAPQSDYLRAAIIRVSAAMGDAAAKRQSSPLDKGEGALVILFEQGFVPERTEFALSVPNFDGNWISVAFPFYSDQAWPAQKTLRVLDQSSSQSAASEVLVDYGNLAVKHLKEQLPSMIVRQVLRAFSKYEIQQRSADSYGNAGLFLSSIYTILSERADLRSWLTLPHTGQIMRMTLAEGQRDLNLRVDAADAKFQANIVAGRTTVLRVIAVEGRFYIHELKL